MANIVNFEEFKFNKNLELADSCLQSLRDLDPTFDHVQLQKMLEDKEKVTEE